MIQFELVSPEKKLMSGPVAMAVIPGSEGDFGVLSNHMPLISTIGAGVVKVYKNTMDHVSERIFVAGGVADVTGAQCTVLAEQAINVNDIDVDDVNRQISEIEEDLKSMTDKVDIARFCKKLDVLNAMRHSVQ